MRAAITGLLVAVVTVCGVVALTVIVVLLMRLVDAAARWAFSL